MKNLFKNLLYCAWILLCSLTLVELTLRYFAPAPEIELLNISTSNQMQYQLVNNKKLIYIPVPNSGPLNSWGHRGKDFSKTKNGTRWIIIGDSVVEGYGVETEQRFTDLLQKNLDLEIINLGVRGYNLWQYVEYLKLKDIPAEILTVGITFNDLELHSGEINAFKEQIKKLRKNGLYRSYYSQKKLLLEKLLKLNFIRYSLAFFSPTSSEAFDHNGNGLFQKDHALNAIRELKQLADQRKMRLSFIIFPTNPNVYIENQIYIIKKILNDEKLSFLDLERKATEKFSADERKTWFLNSNDPCHFSPIGMEKVKDLILELGKNTIF